MKARKPPADRRTKCEVCQCYCRKQDMHRYDKVICQRCESKLDSKGLRHCRIGNHVSEIRYFDLISSGYRRRSCRSCIRKQDMERHPDTRRLRDQAYNRDHPRINRDKKQAREQKKRWRDRNPTKSAIYTKNWRDKNHDRVLANASEYRSKNRDKIRSQQRRSYLNRKVRRLIKVLHDAASDK